MIKHGMEWVQVQIVQNIFVNSRPNGHNCLCPLKAIPTQ